MEKRALIDEEKKAVISEIYKIIILLIVIIIGLVVVGTSCRIATTLFDRPYKNQYESCEEEARRRLDEMISFIDSKQQSEDFSVSYKTPSVTVEMPNSKVIVKAEYVNGEVAITLGSSYERRLAISITMLSTVGVYVLLIICICRIRKRKSAM